jgi:hypothetical protein
MTDLEAKAAVSLARLQDYARDLEADLGKIERNHTNNPDLGHVPAFTPAGDAWDIAQQNAGLAHHRIIDYSRWASAALTPFNGQELTTGEKSAVAAIRDLVTAIQSISTRSDATALVASF